MSVFNLHQGVVAGTAAAGGSAVFDSSLIGNSAWLDGSADTLEKTFSSGSAQTKVVISTWVQRHLFGINDTFFSATGGTGGSSRSNRLSFKSDDTFDIHLETSTLKTIIYSTTAVFRDISWYHILVSIDQGQSEGPEQVKLFVNGTEVTIAATDLDQGFSASLSSWGNACKHNIGSSNGASQFFKGSITQTTMLVGQSIQSGDVAVSDFLDTFTFGTNGSQFIPKKDSDIAALATTAGGNSFCLDYGDSSDLGNDISSNNNDFTATSMSSANQSTNTPSKVYPKMNPLNDVATVVLSEDNTRVNAQVYASIRSTAFASAGKRYAEITVNTVGNSYLGVAVNGTNPTSFAATGVVACQQDGDIYVSSASPSGNKCPTYTTSDVLGILIDVDADKFWVSKNGTFYSMDRNPTITLTAEQVLAGTGGFDLTALGSDGSYGIHVGNSDGTASDVSVNFGQYSYTHTPPTGYINWASDNFDAPEYQGIDYFDATLYEGNGENQRVGDFVPFTDTFTISSSAMWYSEDIRRLSHTYSSEATATSDDSTDAAVYLKATISFWVKFVETADSDQQVFISQSNSGETERFIWYAHGTDDYVYIMIDPSGSDNNRNFRFDKGLLSTQNWSNCVLHLDTNNSTAADRMKLWINGNSITNTETSRPYTNMTQGQALNLFRNEELMIGHLSPSDTYASVYNFNSYLAEFHVIDGYNKAVSDFGQVDTSTNRWVPKDYKTNVGTYGNRGFYLKFDGTPGAGSGSDMGKDSSGNNIHLTEETHGSGSAWATSDKFVDTPSKNFNVFDHGLNGVGTLSEGNTRIVTASDQRTTYTTMNIPATGKWYWEVDVVNYVTGGSVYLGVVEFDELVTGNDPINGLTRQVIFDNFQGQSYVYGSSATGTTWCNSPGGNNFNADGDVLQFALDQDAGTLFIGNNNTWFRAGGARDTFANATTVGQRTFKTGVKRRFLLGRGGSFGETYEINFGQKSSSFSGSSTTLNTDADGYFVYTPPTGYKALNQDNLDSTASEITAFAWIKNRDAGDSHILVDRVRGVGQTLNADDFSIETTEVNTVQRFLQRGVQVANDVQVNTSGESYVLWQWLAGESAGTGSVTSPAGGISSNTIVSTPGNFSVGTYTGTGSTNTVGHGLGGAPELIFIKNRSSGSTSTADWVVGVDPWTDYGHLDTSGEFVDNSTKWNDTDPTATVFTIGTNNRVNKASDNYVFYAFRSVPGVCKIGTYEGNGASDGAYISMGFKPRWVMVKVYDAGVGSDGNWTIYDTTRQPFNSDSSSPTLFADNPNPTSGPERSNSHKIDILSDGVKFRDNSNQTNSARTYIYLAMAEIGGNGTLPPIYGR